MVVVLSKFMPQCCLCSSVAELDLQEKKNKKATKEGKEKKTKRKKEERRERGDM